MPYVTGWLLLAKKDIDMFVADIINQKKVSECVRISPVRHQASEYWLVLQQSQGICLVSCLVIYYVRRELTTPRLLWLAPAKSTSLMSRQTLFVQHWDQTRLQNCRLLAQPRCSLQRRYLLASV